RQWLHSDASGKKIDSMQVSNRAAMRKANGRLGSYLPVSMALTVCLDTSRRSPSCACDQPRASRSSQTRLFIVASFVAPGDHAPGDAVDTADQGEDPDHRVLARHLEQARRLQQAAGHVQHRDRKSVA